MKRSAGFTLIELLITIIIMVILLTLGVVSLRSTQMTGRDEKRKTDVSVIAQQLEHYYTSGNNTTSSPPGKYPPIDAFGIPSITETGVKTVLRDLDPKVLRGPDVADTSAMSFMVATTATPEPSPTINQYIYLPLNSADGLCKLTTEECRKFTLYYRLESSPDLQKIESKNQ